MQCNQALFFQTIDYGMKTHILLLSFFLNASFLLAQNNPDLWWKRNNLRVIQMNLPAYEAATINADSIVTDLVACSANTLLINAGGIMAFYPTKLDFHYRNPYLKDNNVLADVVRKCHEKGI